MKTSVKTAVVTRRMTAAITLACVLCVVSSVEPAFISSTRTAAGRISISKGPGLLTGQQQKGFSLPHSSTFMASTLQMSTDETFDDVNDRDNRNSGSRNQYQLPSDAGPIASTCKLTEEQIHFLISKRSECKSARNFAEADRILDGLVKAGVFLHDNRKEWRADGNNHFGRTNDHRHREYVRRGGDHGLSEEAIAEIASVVELRAQAKRKKDFLTSDELTEQLKTKYGVHMNDKKREWSLSFVNYSEEEEQLISVYVPSPIAPLDSPTHTMDEESKALIQKRLTDRLLARRSRDYALADFIRDKLQEEFSVVIDDRTREWKIATGEEDDSFVKEAQASQRSAFVRENKIVDVVEEDSQREIDDAFSEIFEDSPIEDDEPSFLVEEAALAAPQEQEAAPVAVQEQETESQLMTLTIPVLKEKLRDAGLPVSGKKAELVERLLETSN